jgi:hypothetical protein
MRSAPIAWRIALLASLGLHGGAVLALFSSLHRVLPAEKNQPVRADAWLGNGVEVEAPSAPATEPRSEQSQAEWARATEPQANTAPHSMNQESARLASPESRARERTNERVPHAGGRAKSGSKKPAASAAEPTVIGGSGASYGATGLPALVRSLPSAFTRAIPPAVSADPIWQNLPLGVERPFTVAIAIDDQAHISAAELLPDKSGRQPERQALLLRERVVSLLGGGLFALQNDTGAGRELFRVTITLSERPVRDDEDPAQRVERGFDPPRAGAPGHAYFTLVSGRHFDAEVRVVARP